jgi:hypothetical protein
LTLPLIAAAVAVTIAALAWLRARSAGRRAERLAESYWELRYEIGQMKVRMNRLETAAGVRPPEPEADAAPQRTAPTTTFVPLSSLKK